MLVVAVMGAGTARAQDRPTKGSDFPAAQFDSLDRIAFYLAQYDSFAWHTTDSLSAKLDSLGPAVMNRLGEEWFAYGKDSVWHAVYGRYHDSTDTYDAVVHYTGSGGRITRSAVPFDQSLANRLGRALFISKQHLPKALASANIRFNSYVKVREDRAIDVWFVPAWQSNGWLVYGSEFQYTMDPEGRTVRDSVVRFDNIKGMRADSTQTLQLVHANTPGIATVAEILFMRLYSGYFAHVRVITRDWVSEFFKAGEQRAWLHALRSP